MIKYLVLSIFSVLILSQDWHEYSSRDGLLQFKSPVTMRYGTDVAFTSIGDITLNIYKSAQKDSFDTKYSVTYYELPVYLNMESDSMFVEMTEGTVESMLEFTQSELDYSNISEYRNGYMRTSRITYGEHYVSKSIILSNGTHMVNAQCFVPLNQSLNDNVEEFFDNLYLHSLLQLKKEH